MESEIDQLAHKQNIHNELTLEDSVGFNNVSESKSCEINEDGDLDEQGSIKLQLLKNVQNKLQNLLEAKQPEYFNLSWVEQNSSFLYEKRICPLLKMYEDRDCGIKSIMEGISGNWAAKFRVGEIEEFRIKRLDKRKGEIFDKIIAELEQIFESHVGEITVEAIIDKNKNLYKRIRHNIRKSSEKGIDWEKIRQNLKIEYRSRLVIPESRSERDTFEVAIKKICEIIRNNPALPKYIKVKDLIAIAPVQYDALKELERDEDGDINWKKIKEAFDRDILERIILPRKMKYVFPDKLYEDVNEVNKKLDEFKSDLYTFFKLLNKDDSQKRNRICVQLVEMAQKGNESARERLMFFLMPIIEQWIDNDDSFWIYENHREEMLERIKKCIYFYYDEKVNFLWYLRSSLLKDARRMEFEKNEILRKRSSARSC